MEFCGVQEFETNQGRIGAAALPWSTKGIRYMKTQKQLKVGIIGQGRSGRNIHGAHLIDSTRYKIVAVAEPIENRRQRAVEEYGCEVYANHKEMFARRDLDLIVNASFSHNHPDVSIDCLNAGFNVLCEKPMAATLQDADRMIAAAHKSGKLLAIFQQSRFSPAFQEILKVLQSGVLGRVVQISIAYNGFSRRWDWQTLQSHRGGNLMNTGPHPLDQALQLFGDGEPNVCSFMDRANTVGDAEDYVKLILSGPGKPVIDIEISSCCAFPNSTYNIHGTNGGLKGSTTQLEWKFFKPEEAPQQKYVDPISNPDGTPAYCGENLVWHTEDWALDPTASNANDSTYQSAATDLMATKSKPKASSNLFDSMAASYYSMLYDALTTGAPMTVTPEQVRRQMAVFEKCREQAPNVYKTI